MAGSFSFMIPVSNSYDRSVSPFAPRKLRNFRGAKGDTEPAVPVVGWEPGLGNPGNG